MGVWDLQHSQVQIDSLRKGHKQQHPNGKQAPRAPFHHAGKCRQRAAEHMSKLFARLGLLFAKGLHGTGYRRFHTINWYVYSALHLHPLRSQEPRASGCRADGRGSDQAPQRPESTISAIGKPFV